MNPGAISPKRPPSLVLVSFLVVYLIEVVICTHYYIVLSVHTDIIYSQGPLTIGHVLPSLVHDFF